MKIKEEIIYRVSADLTEDFILTIICICRFQGNADWSSNLSMFFNLPLCSIKGRASSAFSFLSKKVN